MLERGVSPARAGTTTVELASFVRFLFPSQLNWSGMNELIKILIKKKKKIGVFPIKDSDWKDTGNWFDYMKAIQQTQ